MGVLEFRAWLLILLLTRLGLAPSSYPVEIVGIGGRFVGIGGIPPHIFVWIGAIPSGEGFVWAREQQSKGPCGLGSCGSQSGTEGALPGAAREV